MTTKPSRVPRPPAACPACGRRLAPAERAITLRGERYHRACALYRPRRRSLAA